MHRAKQKDLDEMIHKLEKKGERSQDCRVNLKDVYTIVSEHSALKAKKMHFYKSQLLCWVMSSSCVAQSKV